MFVFRQTHRVASNNYSTFRASLLSCLSKSSSPRSANVSSASMKFSIDEAKAQSGFDWEVRYNKPSLWILGVWPLDNKCVHLKFVLCLCLLMMYALPSTVRIVYIGSYGSVEGPLQIITEVTPIIFIIMQLSVFKSKNSQVKVILTKMYENWGQSTNLTDDDKKPMFIYGGRTRFTVSMCTAFFFMSCFAYFGAPLLTMLIKGNISMKSLPNKGLYPFDTDVSPNYQIVYTMQSFLGLMCAMSWSSIDGFLVLAVFHGCGQLAVLCKIIDRYEGQTRHASASIDESKKNFNSHCSCLKCIVDRHVSLSQYAKIVDDIFNEVIMARLITNTVLFCGEGYIIIKSHENSNFFDLLLNALYMGTMTFNFFLYCWIGEQLLEESENVGRAVCKLNWHKEKPKIAQSLILPILRSRKPLKITAGRFFIMSHSCFKEWLVHSMGYLSVILALKTHA